MRKIEIKCNSKKTAIAKVQRIYGITVVKDLTKQWENAGKPLEKDKFLFFILEQLADLELEGENLGIIIATKPASPMPLKKVKVVAHPNPPRKQYYYLKYGIYEQGSNNCLEKVDTLYEARKAVFRWYRKLRVYVEARKLYEPKENPVVYSVQGDDETDLKTRALGEYIIVGFAKWLQ